MSNYKLYSDCIHFPLDRPCKYQKDNNMICDKCSHYVSISKKNESITKILIIKLGAMGDVLRTTFILEGLKEKHKNVHIDWLVDKRNVDVLIGNQYITNIVSNDSKVFDFLTSNKYDYVINLDLSPESLSFTTLAYAEKKIGYWLDDKRNIRSSNEYAKQWLLTSAYDELKKANDKSYQYWMGEITEISNTPYEIIVPISSEADEKAKKFKNLYKFTDKKVIGVNPGAGKRWKMKKWNIEKYIELIKILSSKNHTVLLLGGRDDEEEIKQILAQNIPNVFSTGIDNSVQEFFAMINLCDIIVCGDTMAMHAGLGLNKNIVAIFGPTSSAEIELYGRGKKIISDGCNCCYRQNCLYETTCMDKISVDMVLKEVELYI